MRKIAYWQILCISLLGGLGTAQAAQVNLADWCVNVNGSISVCNGGSASGNGVSTAGFDTTIGNNTLGSITYTAGAAGYVSFYADYDIDFATKGSFSDSAATNGALPANWSYELDDPNTSNIFSDFSGNTLANTNNVGTPTLPPTECCDASFALGIGGLSVGDQVTFTVSSTKPGSGFYISQVNQYTADAIYLSATVTQANNGGGGGGGSNTPEPSTFGLAASLIGFGIALKKFKRA